MHKVDSFGATSINEFANGDPQTGVPRTRLEAKWINALQRELVGIVEQAGLTLSDVDDAQIRASVILHVTTVAALRLVPIPPGAARVHVTIEGFQASDDGGDGVYRWDPGSSAADDGDLVVMPSSSPANGRWLRVQTTARFRRTSAEVALGVNPINFTFPEGHAWRYLTAGQLADVRAFGFGINVTAALQSAMNVAWEAGCECFVPAGGYLVTTLSVPGSANRRERAFTMTGAGVGEIFDRSMNSGTILRGTGADAPILRYIQDVPNTGGGNVYISHLRLEGNSATAYVIDLDAFYTQSHLHHCTVYQAGNGGGLHIGLSNGVLVEENYLINHDWNNASLGAARTGTGIRIDQDIDTGLTKVCNNSVRGWLTGMDIGDGADNMYKFICTGNEFSVVHHGLRLRTAVNKATVRSNYFEGGDQGIGILDQGNYNTIADNLIFAGFGISIDMSNASAYGTYCTGNVIGCGTTPNSKLIKVGSSAASGGPAKVVKGNTLAFGGSGGRVAGVVGLTITGIEPRLEISGNAFDPRGPWVGGAGTTKVSDVSTGGGIWGLSFVAVNNEEMPCLSRGVVAWGRSSTLGDTAIASNVLTLSAASYHVLNAASAATVNAIAPTTLDGKEFIVRTVNANVTFANTAKLRLAGGVNFTPGTSGAMLTFVVEGGVVYERCRTAY